MFYAIPYRIFFHDTMAYGTHHFLTNFKFQCEARESLLFQERDLYPPQERHKLEDVLFLTLDAFSRSMNSVPVGAKVAILLSIEDIAPSSCRFCFRVVGEQGHPVACGFQTVATLSAKTRQMVAFPRFVHGPTFMRERLFAPDFQTRVLAGNTKSIFSEHVVQTGIRIASGLYCCRRVRAERQMGSGSSVALAGRIGRQGVSVPRHRLALVAAPGNHSID